MGTLFVPSLGESTVLSDPNDMITETLRNWCYFPSNQTEIYRSYAISLSDALSTLAPSPTKLVERVKSDLANCFIRMFSDVGGDVDIDASTTEVSATSYTLSITVSVRIGGQAYMVSPQIEIGTDGTISAPWDTV